MVPEVGTMDTGSRARAPDVLGYTGTATAIASPAIDMAAAAIATPTACLNITPALIGQYIFTREGAFSYASQC